MKAKDWYLLMFKFNKGKRKDFKTDEAFLRDVYRRNASLIPNTEDQFVKQIIGYKTILHSEGKRATLTSALSTLAKSRAYTPYKDMAGENVRRGLIKHGLYNQFQTGIRDKSGRFTSLDWSKLTWDKDREVYNYDGKVLIDFRNSPEMVYLTWL